MIRRRIGIAALVLVAGLAFRLIGQTTKEYIRLGGRVIAIETTTPAAPQVIFGQTSATANAEGKVAELQLSLQAALAANAMWTATASPGMRLAVRVSPTCPSQPPSSAGTRRPLADRWHRQKHRADRSC